MTTQKQIDEILQSSSSDNYELEFEQPSLIKNTKADNKKNFKSIDKSLNQQYEILDQDQLKPKKIVSKNNKLKKNNKADISQKSQYFKLDLSQQKSKQDINISKKKTQTQKRNQNPKVLNFNKKQIPKTISVSHQSSELHLSQFEQQQSEKTSKQIIIKQIQKQQQLNKKIQQKKVEKNEKNSKQVKVEQILKSSDQQIYSEQFDVTQKSKIKQKDLKQQIISQAYSQYDQSKKKEKQLQQILNSQSSQEVYSEHYQTHQNIVMPKIQFKEPIRQQDGYDKQVDEQIQSQEIEQEINDGFQNKTKKQPKKEVKKQQKKKQGSKKQLQKKNVIKQGNKQMKEQSSKPLKKQQIQLKKKQQPLIKKQKERINQNKQQEKKIKQIKKKPEKQITAQPKPEIPKIHLEKNIQKHKNDSTLQNINVNIKKNFDKKQILKPISKQQIKLNQKQKQIKNNTIRQKTMKAILQEQSPITVTGLPKSDFEKLKQQAKKNKELQFEEMKKKYEQAKQIQKLKRQQALKKVQEFKKNKQKLSKKPTQKKEQQFEIDNQKGDNAIMNNEIQKKQQIVKKDNEPSLSAMGRLKNNKNKKNEMQTLLQQEMIKKLKILNKEVQAPKPEQVKQLRKVLKQDKYKLKMQEVIREKKEDNLTNLQILKNKLKSLKVQKSNLIKRIKQQQQIKSKLNEKILFEQKQTNVIILDKNQYTSYGLVADLKNNQKGIIIKQKQNEDNAYSEETPVEKFVNFFLKQNYEQHEIFDVLDVNSDQLLTINQLKQICKRLKVNLTIEQFDELFKILDYNEDGSITSDEFEFIISEELEKRKGLNNLLGDIIVQNPIELQQRILDMKTRMKYMDEFIQKDVQQQDPKYNKLLKQLNKYQNKIKKRDQKQISKASSGETNQFKLLDELRILQSEQQNQQRLYNLIKTQIQSNIKQKTLLMKQKAQQQLKCREQLYNIKNELQEKELRFITYEKIVQNKRRYLEQAKAQQKQFQIKLKETAQYKNKIINQKIKTQKNSKLSEMNLLSAVLMIQRNYRKKKQMKKFKQLKQAKV